MAHPTQPTGQQSPESDPAAVKVIALSTDTTVAYQSVIKPPFSHKLHSGFMRIQPVMAGEEHSTEGYEELIVLISGTAVLHYSDSSQSVSKGQIVYIPPHTKHFLENSGERELQYVYIVTKVE